MAKGKNLNPADAYRKAQRKKELKKNKTERAKARDFALVKKDTRDLEDEIEKLEASPELSVSGKSRLTSLKNELLKVMKKKDEYVKEHPEHRRLVYRPRRQEKGEDQNRNALAALTTNEVDSDEDVGDSDEDIVMPEGPPPDAGLKDSESGSDDDIPMPEGPPPNNFPNHNNQAPSGTVPPPFPPPPPHIPPSMSSFALPPPPPLPPGFGPRFFPRQIQDPLSYIPHQTYQAHHASQLPPGHPSLPPKPPTGAPGYVPAGVHTGAVISAEPELRDLKKEATTFVPASLRRKKPSGPPGSSKVNAAPSVNVGSEATSPQARPDLLGVLRSQLGTVTAPASNSQMPEKGPRAPTMKEKDDYQKFVDEMSDLLGPSS